MIIRTCKGEFINIANLVSFEISGARNHDSPEDILYVSLEVYFTGANDGQFSPKRYVLSENTNSLCVNNYKAYLSNLNSRLLDYLSNEKTRVIDFSELEDEVCIDMFGCTKQTSVFTNKVST